MYIKFAKSMVKSINGCSLLWHVHLYSCIWTGRALRSRDFWNIHIYNTHWDLWWKGVYKFSWLMISWANGEKKSQSLFAYWYDTIPNAKCMHRERDTCLIVSIAIGIAWIIRLNFAEFHIVMLPTIFLCYIRYSMHAHEYSLAFFGNSAAAAAVVGTISVGFQNEKRQTKW